MQRLLQYFCCAVALAAVPLRAENYIIVDNQTGRVLEQSGKDRKVPVASLTKLALAMVVLDWAQLTGANLDEAAVVPEAAVTTTGGINPLGLQPGDTLSLRDLIYACLLA